MDGISFPTRTINMDVYIYLDVYLFQGDARFAFVYQTLFDVGVPSACIAFDGDIYQGRTSHAAPPINFKMLSISKE